jgi:hypothetical protein
MIEAALFVLVLGAVALVVDLAAAIPGTNAAGATGSAIAF